LLFIVYTAAGYPVLLYLWSKILPKKIDKADLFPEPFVSIVIAARDEEKNIKSRIENLFSQDYPVDKLEIIIISDGSIDGTPLIVRKVIDQRGKMGELDGNPIRVKLIELNIKQGKPNALNAGVREAAGDFIVFTDARQKFNKNAVRELIANFNDPTVGSVSGELKFFEKSDSTLKDEMKIYWSLEKKVRKMESIVHSVPGATGAIYAIRKSLFTPIPEKTLLDDVYIPMKVIFQGYRSVFDSRAVAYDVMSVDVYQEKRRKVRTLVGNYQLVKLLPQILSPFKNPVWFTYLSHKLFRLFIPFLFFTMILAASLATGFLYKLTLVICVLVLLLALFDPKTGGIPIIGKISKISRTFVILNYFAFLSFFYFLWTRKKNNIW